MEVVGGAKKYTMREFKKAVADGILCDSEGGGGVYLEGSINSGKYVSAADVLNGDLDESFSHILWVG